MQSDGNSFCGNVVSDNINKTSRGEDKHYKPNLLKQLCLYYYYDEIQNYMKMHTNTVALK